MTATTAIDFYVLEGDGTRDAFACRLAEEAYLEGHRVHLNAMDEAHARRLDALLWTFSDGSFVPHALQAAVEDVVPAVVIASASEPLSDRDVLLNLAREVPTFYSRFGRVAEVVDGDDEGRARGRERYRFYRDRGHRIQDHRV